MKRSIFKKVAIATIAVTMCATTVVGQDQTFGKGDNVINLGIGFGGSWYSGYGFGWNGVTRLPTLSLSYEHCIVGSLWDDRSSIGVGGQFGYTRIKWKDSDWRISNTTIGVRGALHYAFVDKLDTYAGLMMGYKIVSDNSDWNYKNQFVSDYYLGARYYFSDNFAAFAELGYYWSLLNIGVSLKF